MARRILKRWIGAGELKKTPWEEKEIRRIYVFEVQFKNFEIFESFLERLIFELPQIAGLKLNIWV